MAAPMHQSDQIVISEDAARGGVVGHNVRYVLTFGLTGVIAVFAAIALWAGYDDLQARLSSALTYPRLTAIAAAMLASFSRTGVASAEGMSAASQWLPLLLGSASSCGALT